MRVLCGQCGQLNELEDDYGEPDVACSRCGRMIPVAAVAEGQPGGAGEAPAVEPANAGESEEPGFAEQARQSTGRKIPVTCPNCGKTVQVSARVAGRKARCKGCDHPLEIPYPDDLEEFELPALYKGEGEYETGLVLLPPPQADEPEPERPQVETESAVELVPQPDLAPEPVAHELAELAALNTGADLAALDRDLDFVQALPTHSEETGQLVSAFQDFHEGKQAARARSARGPGILRWLILLTIAAAAIMLPLLVVVPILTRDDANSGIASVRPDDGEEPNDGTTRPVVAPATKAATTGTKPAPKPVVPGCEVLAITSMPFIADGYFPASAGSLYWRITANVSAGREQISFATSGSDVRLVFGNERFASLGEPAGNEGLFPARGRQTTISLQPGEARKATFLFEVPTDLTRGRLFIRGVTYEDIVLPAPQQLLPAARLAGTYQETPPRHLKPMLRDPVMAAIQAAGRQEMVVSPDAQGIRVTIPAARVTGVGKQVAPGLFRTILKRRDHSLDAAVRFVEGGRRVVLYLADRPYHQLTYANSRAMAPPEPPGPKPVAKPPPARPIVGPGIRTIWDESHGFDPNSRPDPNEKIVLPTGPSIFD